MECREVRQLADAFVSDQVLVETAHAIVAHLERCPSCRAEIEGLRRLRAGVRSAVLNAPELTLSPAFASALAGRLQDEAARRPAPVVSRRVWLALAASVVLVVGAGLGWQRWSAAAWTALLEAASGDHQNCALTFKLAEAPIPLAEAARRFGGIFGPLDTVQPSMSALAGGAVTVLDRHSCVFDGHRFAHIVLRYKDETVSVLVPDDTRPGGPPWGGPQVDGAIASAGSSGVFHTVLFVGGRHVAFVVSSLGESDVREVAQAMVTPVTRALAGA